MLRGSRWSGRAEQEARELECSVRDQEHPELSKQPPREPRSQPNARGSSSAARPFAARVRLSMSTTAATFENQARGSALLPSVERTEPRRHSSRNVAAVSSAAPCRATSRTSPPPRHPLMVLGHQADAGLVLLGVNGAGRRRGTTPPGRSGSATSRADAQRRGTVQVAGRADRRRSPSTSGRGARRPLRGRLSAGSGHRR